MRPDTHHLRHTARTAHTAHTAHTGSRTRGAGAGLGRRLALAALSLATAACTTLPTTPLVRDEGGCHEWTARLDAAIASAGVADAEAEPLAGFPGLRVDRVAAALREPAAASEPAFAAWLARTAALDRAARAAEIANLPEGAFPLGPALDRAQALARTDACREGVQRQLREPRPSAPPGGGELARPETLRQALLARATVPDRYSTASRALGLYPLLRWPFFAGVEGWQREQAADMARWASAPPPLQAFVPPAEAPGEGAASGSLGAPSPAPPPWPPVRDALGLPQPTPAEAQQLLAWHAPAFELEVRGPFDRIGVPHWAGAPAEARPQVDTQRPVVYQRIGHMRLHGRWQLQLVYTVWFPERPARSGLDLLAGALDGVIVRLTLGDDGQPLLLDTIHACGCYHMFFPAPTLRARAGAPTNEEWMFAPAALPPLAPHQRLAVRIASLSHYVNGVVAVARAGTPGEAGPERYELEAEQAMRSLPSRGSSTTRRSLYGPDGLVAGSERGERFLFWPMGIASAGAMRQWGHHATAFVGRRHFDDPVLLEQRFEAALAVAGSATVP
jgi:hypothetical protein